jgi:Fe2+ or Zn2+ uptake regulation protein
VSTETARNQFKTHLADRGLRVTGQRLAILDAALAQAEHFTAEELLAHARALDRSVSRATVYRTLPILTGSALLREVDIGTGEKFYRPAAAGASTQVAQVVCADCDRIFEISAPFMEWYGSTVSAKLNLTPVTQRLQVSARCNRLRDTGACPHRN